MPYDVYGYESMACFREARERLIAAGMPRWREALKRARASLAAHAVVRVTSDSPDRPGVLLRRGVVGEWRPG